MRTRHLLSSIKGRLIALVTFFMFVLLGFSLIMLQRNNQIKDDVQHLLEVRMRIRDATENTQSSLDIALSNSRRSVLKKIALSSENQVKVVQQEAKVLDSLGIYLGDTGAVMLQTLSKNLVNFTQDYARADSIWNRYLAEEQATKIRLFAVDPSTTTFRLVTQAEKGYQLSSDTLAEILIEAEEAFYVGAFSNYSHTGFQGKGYADYTNREKDFIEWKFSTPRSGKHIIVFHYANGSTSDRPLSLSVDGTIVDSLWSFPPLGQNNWTAWADTEGLEVHLGAGVHTLRATAIGKSGGNIDYLKIIASAPYADASIMYLPTQKKGIVDEAAVATLTEKIVDGADETDIMNGVEDIMRASNNEINRSITSIIEQNNRLLGDDIARLQQQLQKTNIFNFVTFGIVAILAAMATYIVLKSLNKSIARPAQQIQRLSVGETNLKLDATQDELNVVVQASNQLRNHLNQASEFAREIGEGNLQHHFAPSSKNDVLGNALIQMRDQLQVIKEEDRRRNWQSDGLTKFAELLRKEYENKYDMAVCIISNLVKYLKANQGGLFFYNDQDEDHLHLELIGCYAYDRRKYLKKEIMVGEGLVGQTFLEGEITCLTEIPDNYLSIRSGLGGANPKCLLIVPLKTDEKIEGVIEIASFNELAEHEIELIEKIAEVTASHMASMRMSEQTRTLLEETQAQTMKLREQEEELRQNMEEMQATQEQIRRDSRLEIEPEETTLSPD